MCCVDGDMDLATELCLAIADIVGWCRTNLPETAIIAVTQCVGELLAPRQCWRSLPIGPVCSQIFSKLSPVLGPGPTNELVHALLAVSKRSFEGSSDPNASPDHIDELEGCILALSHLILASSDTFLAAVTEGDIRENIRLLVAGYATLLPFSRLGSVEVAALVTLLGQATRGDPRLSVAVSMPVLVVTDAVVAERGVRTRAGKKKDGGGGSSWVEVPFGAAAVTLILRVVQRMVADKTATGDDDNEDEVSINEDSGLETDSEDLEEIRNDLPSPSVKDSIGAMKGWSGLLELSPSLPSSLNSILHQILSGVELY